VRRSQSAFSMGARKGRGYSITPRPDLQSVVECADHGRLPRLRLGGNPSPRGLVRRLDTHSGAGNTPTTNLLAAGRLRPVRHTWAVNISGCERSIRHRTEVNAHSPHGHAQQLLLPSQRATDGAGSRHPVLSRLPYLLTTWEYPTAVPVSTLRLPEQAWNFTLHWTLQQKITRASCAGSTADRERD